MASQRRDPRAEPVRNDLVERLVRRDLLLLRLEAARGRRTARVAGVVGLRRLGTASARSRGNR
jgi:hypothetical protein